MDPNDFARELKVDFSPDKVVNVNKLEDLQKRQIQLNTLEERNNEIRVIFAVDKLNEGWDVLNLFDIVRLYDTRDGKGNKVGRTTMQEAQLIGRGARYFPFIAPEQPEAVPEKRKYDRDTENSLRVLEQLHYHCSHNPRYIDDIKNALRETGMIDDTVNKITLSVKPSFKETSFYKTHFIWVNERKRNDRLGIDNLRDYLQQTQFCYPTLKTGLVTESSAFEAARAHNNGGEQTISRTLNISDFSTQIVRFALDTNNFFHLANLRTHFPQLSGISDFMSSERYLGSVKVNIRGLSSDLDALDARQKVEITQFVLHQIETGIKAWSIDFVGTKEFKRKPVKELIVDKTIKLRVEGEAGLRWTESKIEGLQLIDLESTDWYVYNDSVGSDQEKLFIRHVHDNAERLRKSYDVFYLIRNEKVFKLFAFENGQPFEPDFILILRRKEQAVETILQLFVEPKGSHLIESDKWKEEFLLQIAPEARLDMVFQGKNYLVRGLPFFNNTQKQLYMFNTAFEAY